MTKSKIEWTDETWNPLRGTKARHVCVKISPACDHCYAGQYNGRYCGRDFPDARDVDLRPSRHGIPLLVTHDGAEIDTVRLDEQILLTPLRWQRPRLVFVCSMTDVAGEWVPDEWLDAIFTVMALADRHTFQVLTKRPDRLAVYLATARERIYRHMLKQAEAGPNGWAMWAPNASRHRSWIERWAADHAAWPLPNVWVGTTVELDRFAWRANKYLRETPAAARFVSAEPLLGPLPSLELACPACNGHGADAKHCSGPGCDWEHVDASEWCRACEGTGRAIDWLIVGGESRGPADRALVARCFEMEHQVGGRGKEHCRACNGTGWMPKPAALAWVRDLRDRARAAGTAFFFKQFGGPRPTSGGRLLDGREWNELPEAIHAER